MLSFCQFFLTFLIVAGFAFAKFGALSNVDWMTVLGAWVKLKGRVKSIEAYSIH